MNPELSLSPIFESIVPANKLALDRIIQQSLAICMEVLVAATRQFTHDLSPLSKYKDDSFATQAALFQQQFESMAEYKVIAQYGNEQQQSWAKTLKLSIASAPIHTVADSVVLVFPTVAVLRARLRACLELASA